MLFYLVLETHYYLCLLRSLVARPRLPCLLPPAIFAITRRIIRSIASSLLVAPIICDRISHLHVPDGIDAILGTPTFLNTRVYLVETESRRKPELLGFNSLQGSMAAMGIDGIQSGCPWSHSKRRADGCRCWTYLVFLLRRIPTTTQRVPSIRSPKMVETTF